MVSRNVSSKAAVEATVYASMLDNRVLGAVWASKLGMVAGRIVGFDSLDHGGLLGKMWIQLYKGHEKSIAINNLR